MMSQKEAPMCASQNLFGVNSQPLFGNGGCFLVASFCCCQYIVGKTQEAPNLLYIQLNRTEIQTISAILYGSIFLLLHHHRVIVYVTSLCIEVRTCYISIILHSYLIVTYTITIAHSNSESRMCWRARGVNVQCLHSRLGEIIIAS